MGYIDETPKEDQTVERLIRFMKAVENPSWMIELVENMDKKLKGLPVEEVPEEGHTVEHLIWFMKDVGNPSWMIELVENMNNKLKENKV